MTKENSLIEEAREALEKAIIYYRGRPIGTVAALDPEVDALNYNQCFVRDFVSAALVFLIDGKTEIVRNFLVELLGLQSHRKHLDDLQLGQGLKPASFKVESQNGEECLVADFGEQAIGAVAPVDSMFWWLIILRAYVKATGDVALAHQADFQQGIRLILDLCLEPQFNQYPTLLVPDGSFMIDRRMLVDGYPLEIQALFYAGLRVARELLLPDDASAYLQAVDRRLDHLIHYIRKFYWLDLEQLNQIYRYKGEEYGETAVNKFNIYAASIPNWMTEFLPDTGGYLVGNLGPGRMDFRFFGLGNLMAVITSLVSQQQAQAIMDLIDQRWQELVGYMPLKICTPALEAKDWILLTGADPKNRPWSYHNGGSWPVLLWLVAAAAQKTGRAELAQKATEVAEKRLGKDQWPEYYDGENGRLIGKEARKFQTWTITGYLLAKELLANPNHLALICFDQE